jgi:hypothetical protein
VSVQYHPDIKLLAEKGETVPLNATNVDIDVARKFLLKWVNYHMKKVGGNEIGNFGQDIKVSFKIFDGV